MKDRRLFDYDVFISYNWRDKNFVDFLEACFKRSGLSCFRDVSGLGLYDKLDASLKKKISKSRRLIAIMSPSYLQSYWCLFETLEAIQGQDLSLRFLPVVIQYGPSDQILDEEFVLKALGDLREQRRSLEEKIITARAFALGDKLDKLSFVQNHLPNVFAQMAHRLYPKFKLWDEEASRKTMADLVAFLDPPIASDLNAVPFDPGPHPTTPFVMPPLDHLPAIIWKTYVGFQSSKNSPLHVGSDILVPTSGLFWNKPDEKDGVFCLHAATGRVRWFAATNSDANSLLVSKGLVLTACDDGTVCAFLLINGQKVWSVKLDSAIVGGPMKMPSPSGRSVAELSADVNYDPILVVTYNGDIHLLDLSRGTTICILHLNTFILTPPVHFRVRAFPRDLLAFPAVDGKLHFIVYDSISIQLSYKHVLSIMIPDKHSDTGYAAPQLSSTPIYENGQLILGFARETYYKDPPLVAINPSSYDINWISRASETVDSESFGNLRGRPVVVKNDVIFAAAYCNGLDAISLETGEHEWSVVLGQTMYEQWSAPLAVGSSIYIGRQDGYLHKVNTRKREREWSIFLGESTRAGSTVGAGQQLPEFSDTASWRAGNSNAIVATPTISRGRLYAGTTEGWLYCLANLGE